MLQNKNKNEARPRRAGKQLFAFKASMSFYLVVFNKSFFAGSISGRSHQISPPACSASTRSFYLAQQTRVYIFIYAHICVCTYINMDIRWVKCYGTSVGDPQPSKTARWSSSSPQPSSELALRIRSRGCHLGTTTHRCSEPS